MVRRTISYVKRDVSWIVSDVTWDTVSVEEYERIVSLDSVARMIQLGNSVQYEIGTNGLKALTITDEYFSKVIMFEYEEE